MKEKTGEHDSLQRLLESMYGSDYVPISAAELSIEDENGFRRMGWGLLLMAEREPKKLTHFQVYNSHWLDSLSNNGREPQDNSFEFPLQLVTRLDAQAPGLLKRLLRSPVGKVEIHVKAYKHYCFSRGMETHVRDYSGFCRVVLDCTNQEKLLEVLGRNNWR